MAAACAKMAGNNVLNGKPRRQANSAFGSKRLQFTDWATLALNLNGPAVEKSVMRAPESILLPFSQTP